MTAMNNVRYARKEGLASMAWYDESPTRPPQVVIDFVERLQQQGISLVDLNSGSSRRGRQFIAETPIGRIWVRCLAGFWALRFALPGARYFANAAEWKACLKGRKHNWRSPSVEESVVWLDEVLSSGVPAGFDVERLDRLAAQRARTGPLMAWLLPSGIAVGLLGVVFVLLWVAAVTNSTIAAVCGGFSVITLGRFLVQWWKFERSLHE